MSQYNELASTEYEVRKSGSDCRAERSKDQEAHCKMVNLKMVNKRALIVAGIAVVAVVLAFVVGYLVRRAVHKPTCDSTVPSASARSMAEREKDWEMIVKKLDATKIDANMKYLSKEPHVAASKRNNELADEYERRFNSYKFDEVEKITYNVLLSYPKRDKPNYASILDSSNKTNFRTQFMEDILDPAENSTEAYQPFNAFGLAGTVTGDLVYVNFGTREDFKRLKETYNVNCTGKIAIVRYGKIYRGAKVKNAQDNGAIGIMIYNDPQNYGPVPANMTYPNSLWMPRGGVQRGSIGLGDGDILTPGWPSTDDAYRLPISTAPGLPTIPCHPISAKDAKQFLSKLGGQKVTDKDWIGGLDISYHLGPGFSSSYKDWTVKVEVHNTREILKITDVIGTVKGVVEPDRYVMVGNHRDSWVFGGVDASSGGSVLLELARAVGDHMKTGWRPARSLKFCSWGGEEAGLIGSSEYVEQHIKILRERAVTYVNIDTAVYGNDSIVLGASQLTYQTIYKSLKKVKDANTADTMFEKALKTKKSKLDSTKPMIGKVGTGSDYAHFYHYGAIPVIDIMHGMQDIHSKTKGTSYYPVYHSLHDTYDWVKKFIDPKFACHRAVGEFTLRLLLQYSDSVVIPFDPRDFTPALQKGVDDFKALLDSTSASAYNVTTAYLQKAVNSYKAAADLFMTNLEKIDKSFDVNDVENGIIEEIMEFQSRKLTNRNRKIYVDNGFSERSKAKDKTQQVELLLTYLNTIVDHRAGISVITGDSQSSRDVLLHTVEKCSAYGREILGQYVVPGEITEESMLALNLLDSNIVLADLDQLRLQKALSMIERMGLTSSNRNLRMLMTERSITGIRGLCYTPIHQYYYAHNNFSSSNITYITERVKRYTKSSDGSEIWVYSQRSSREMIRKFDFMTNKWIAIADDASDINSHLIPTLPHVTTLTASIAHPIRPWVMFIDLDKTIHHIKICGREGMKGVRFNGSHYIDICVYGFSIDIFRLLQKMLNINYKLLVSRDGLYGSYDLATRKSNGIIREIVEENADIGLDLEENIPRSHVLSFSKPYVISNAALLYVRGDSVRSTGIFAPFHVNLWLGILGSIICVITFVWVLERYTPYGHYKYNQRSIVDNDDHSFNIIESITYVWGTYFTGEIIVMKPRSFASRATTTVVSICAIMIISAYSANLISYLIVVDETPPINGLVDERLIGKHPTVVAATQGGTSFSNYLEKHSDPRLRTLHKRLRYCRFEDCVNSLKRREFDVFIYDYQTLKYIANNDKDCSLKTVKLTMSIRYAVAFRKSWTWKRGVDMAVSNIIESGEVDHLNAKWFGKGSCTGKNTFYAIDIMKLEGLFVILSVSVLIATVVVAIEVIWSHVLHYLGRVHSYAE